MCIESFLRYEKFENINLADPFFDSLKADYLEFEDWFYRKSDNFAYYFADENENIQAFLYLKIENEELTDIIPSFPSKERIKIGTLKINPHGTRLGERFIKKAFDHAISNDIDELYVTVFEKHQGLINLLEKYGFSTQAKKITDNGTELVLFKKLTADSYIDPLRSYPLVNLNNTTPFLLAIYPEFHTRLFPDSILHNESFDMIEDVSYTNSIEKIYIGYAQGLNQVNVGDPIIIYRTGDQKGPAEYRAVATSLCVITETLYKSDFKDVNDFLSYCGNFTVFTEEELRGAFKRESMVVLRMTYNQAFTRRVIRRDLADKCGLNRNLRWSILQLNHHQLDCIIREGGIHESFIID